MSLAFLCDFDGTASPSDIGAAFARTFSPGGSAESPAFLERWMLGEMGHRELTAAQCALLSVSRAQALAFTRPFALDPHFAPFVGEVAARGDAVAVVSEGFDFYVRDLLERAGLGHLPWSSNHLRFEGTRVTPEFPDAADGCGRCGNCKAAHVRAWRARGYRTVLIGDGLSDRCGAKEADEVLARRDLLVWCREAGIPVTPFEDFADVRRWTAEHAANGASRANDPPRLRPPAEASGSQGRQSSLNERAPAGGRTGERRQRPAEAIRSSGVMGSAGHERVGMPGERRQRPAEASGSQGRRSSPSESAPPQDAAATRAAEPLPRHPDPRRPETSTPRGPETTTPPRPETSSQRP